VATLLDTSALVVLLRRHTPAGTENIREATSSVMRNQAAVLSAITVTELMTGARDEAGAARLRKLLDHLPVVRADQEVADRAGRMGREARAAGRTLPIADLLIAATALYLDVALLTCDSDFKRGLTLAEEGGPKSAWSGFRLHPASVLS